jgi:hypothetical protein
MQSADPRPSPFFAAAFLPIERALRRLAAIFAALGR